ncbi:Ldh family oxidoreductase [Patescibacteria group bacterium]|nr:Ldh family oxidoreductase [Patescibacteria group bacterium]
MKITEAVDLSNQILAKLNFRIEEAELITKNLIEAELVEKKTHGLIRLLSIAKLVAQGKIAVNDEDIEVISEHPATIHFNGKYKAGFYVIYKSLEKAFVKVKQSGILAVGLKDLAYASGYIGDYARLAAEKNLIFIGFHNSPGGLVPFGTTKNLWGTNPVTIGVPTYSVPVILDMASSKSTWGNLLLAQNEGKNLEPDLAIDQTGRPTINPNEAMLGGLLPIAGYKGSGLAFIVELLAGNLSDSRVGGAVEGGWGSFYLLIDPALFKDIKSFKDDTQKAIDELKNSPKAEGVSEVFFPGEQSYLKREAHLTSGQIQISDKLLSELEQLT